jgi:hypothetical protein
LQASRGFEVLGGAVVAAHANQERGEVGVAVELAARAREVAVGVVVLAETDLREREVVEDACVAGREFGRALQLVNSRAVVAVQVERVAEVVQGFRVAFVHVNGARVRIFGAVVQPLLVVCDGEKAVRLTQAGVERGGARQLRNRLVQTTLF